MGNRICGVPLAFWVGAVFLSRTPVSADQVGPQPVQTISWYAPAGTRQMQLAQLGSTTRFPVGLIATNKTLCAVNPPIFFKDTPLDAIASSLVAGSGYETRFVDGVLEIFYRSAGTQSLMRILQTKVKRFTGMRAPMSNLGTILSGYILTILHPGEGYAGDLISSPDADRLEPFTLEDVTVEQVANNIVNRGSKGMWIISGKSAVSSDPFIRIFGYKEDSSILSSLACAAELSNSPATNSR